MTRLSICIPTYNRAEILGETLAHLAGVLGDGDEVVVSNNASADHTKTVLESFLGKVPGLRWVTQPSTLQINANHYAAFRLARGRYLYPLCDDDRLLYDGVAKAADMLDSDPGLAAIYGGFAEWDQREDRILSTIRLTKGNETYGAADKIALLDRFVMLWFPVLRTEISQRFCCFDETNWGNWPQVANLLDHGRIAVIPDLFYRHAHTEQRCEHSLTEGWYQDMQRAQFELYIGALGGGSIDNARYITQRSAQAFHPAVQFARMKGQWLAARNFVLRQRAYGLMPEEQIAAWERDHLPAVVADQLRYMIEVTPGITEVVAEENLAARSVYATLRNLRPDLTLRSVGADAFPEMPESESAFYVAWQHESLQNSGIVARDPGRCCGLTDLFANLRLISDPASDTSAGGATAHAAAR